MFNEILELIACKVKRGLNGLGTYKILQVLRFGEI